MELLDLNASQSVCLLQCKYTLYKRVINIVTSCETEFPVDLVVMKKAFDEIVKRNDSLRIRFVKKNKKVMQYFDDSITSVDIKNINFNTKEEQEKFLKKFIKKPIDYMHGVVIEPYFINTYDNKFMLLMKVCHLVLDIYGINFIYKDLFEVYDAFINDKELPECPLSYKNCIINDLKYANDSTKYLKDKEFLQNYLNTHDEPYFVTYGGTNNKNIQKMLKKNKRCFPMKFIHCDTKGYLSKIDRDRVTKLNKFCEENQMYFSNVIYYLISLTLGRMNNNVKDIMPIELVNCRGKISEKKCAGTKVQTITSFTHFDYEKSFIENVKNFCDLQNELYRHVGFSDVEFQMMLNKTFNCGLMNTYYPFSFSLIPYTKPNGVNIRFYSNEKGALISYLALMYDIESNDIDIFYDVQYRIISDDELDRFSENLLSAIDQVLENKDILLNNIKVK